MTVGMDSTIITVDTVTFSIFQQFDQYWLEYITACPFLFSKSYHPIKSFITVLIIFILHLHCKLKTPVVLPYTECKGGLREAPIPVTLSYTSLWLPFTSVTLLYTSVRKGSVWSQQLQIILLMLWIGMAYH